MLFLLRNEITVFSLTENLIFKKKNKTKIGLELNRGHFSAGKKEIKSVENNMMQKKSIK